MNGQSLRLSLYPVLIVLPFLRDEVESLAREMRMRLYRTSVKEDLNVDQVFNFLVERYLAIISHPDDVYSPKTVGESNAGPGGCSATGQRGVGGGRLDGGTGG